jgi:hypothetical protein
MNSNEQAHNGDLVPSNGAEPAGAFGVGVKPSAINSSNSMRRGFAHWFVGIAKASLIFVGISAIVAMAIIVIAHFVPGFSGSVTMGDEFSMPINSVIGEGVAVTLLVWLVMTLAFALAGVAVVISLVFAFLATALALAATLVLMIFSLALVIAPLALPIWFIYWIGHQRGANSAGQTNRNTANA